ncbi:MAG: hypothetical protein MI806_00895 [Minwuiales bacterium]|nr:hypothetical protein [Minwuiales bacterium]
MSDIDRIGVLWEEYKYRHDLVWRVLVTGTVLAATLGAVPYTIIDQIDALWPWVLAPPLASVFVVIGTALVLEREVRLMNHVMVPYHRLRDEFVPLDPLPTRTTQGRFRWAIHPLLALGLILTAGNFLVLLLVYGG